jgi:hypothetical protein
MCSASTDTKGLGVGTARRVPFRSVLQGAYLAGSAVFRVAARDRGDASLEEQARGAAVEVYYIGRAQPHDLSRTQASHAAGEHQGPEALATEYDRVRSQCGHGTAGDRQTRPTLPY